MKNNEHTLEFLTELDDLFIANLLKVEDTERIASLIQNASIAYIHYLSFMLGVGALIYERISLKNSPNRIFSPI